MRQRPEHPFQGDGYLCGKCGLTAHKHRVRNRAYHRPQGNPCKLCGQPANRHPSEDAIERRILADAGRKDRSAQRYIVGIDGEGKDLPDGIHIYTYMAAVSEHGRVVSEARNPNGLSHVECMEMLLRIPKNTRKFAFSFNYDITMMIRELSDADKYKLLRPQTRRVYKCSNECRHKWSVRLGRSCSKCKTVCTKPSHTDRIQCGGYRYDYFNGTFTVAKAKTTCKVWDCFRFFGTSFVEAVTDWNIGSPEIRERIALMKAKRGSFAAESSEEIEKYCQEECHLLALMMKKLIEAHDAADLILTQFHGAGSTASALLKKNSVGDFKGPNIRAMPKGLVHAIMAAFFGGRFENSLVGEVKRPTHGYDIASAYPYAQTELPCLKCGGWKRVSGKGLLNNIKKARLAVCRFRVRSADVGEREKIAWMPLPFRDDHGSICYPTGFEGWAWRPEILSAMTGWPGWIEVLEAWVYETPCKHEPFGYIPSAYRTRIGWGKEGAGKVMKLGMNAGYGKTAQSIGDDPPFRDMVWAGMTTSITRAQIIDAIQSAKDRWAVLSIATDGIYATEELHLPKPRDTGTSDLKKPSGVSAALGCWEYKLTPEGVFLVKPGLYFRRLPESVKDNVRARGVGRREVYEQRKKLIKGFNRWNKKNFKYHVDLKGRRFYGAKHSVSAMSYCRECDRQWSGVSPCSVCGQVGLLRTGRMKTKDGHDAYGRWCVRTTQISFDPRPKREAVMGKNRLRIRDMGGATSCAYKGETTPEGEATRRTKDEQEQQPDWEPDWSEGKAEE